MVLIYMYYGGILLRTVPITMMMIRYNPSRGDFSRLIELRCGRKYLLNYTVMCVIIARNDCGDDDVWWGRKSVTMQGYWVLILRYPKRENCVSQTSQSVESVNLRMVHSLCNQSRSLKWQNCILLCSVSTLAGCWWSMQNGRKWCELACLLLASACLVCRHAMQFANGTLLRAGGWTIGRVDGWAMKINDLYENRRLHKRIAWCVEPES